MNKIVNLHPAQCLIASLFFVGIYWFSFFDNGYVLEQELLQRNAEYSELQKKYSEVSETLKDAASYERLGTELQDLIGRLKVYLPEDNSASKILSVVGELARGSGLDILNLQGNGEVLADNKAYSKISMSLSSKGFFSEIMDFLSSLSSVKSILAIQTISLSRAQSQKMKSQLKFTTRLTGYKYLPEKLEDSSQ